MIRALDAVITARGPPIAAPRCGSIHPGKPVQNAPVERFDGNFRDQCLNQHWLHLRLEAPFLIERFRQDFNIARPHEAHRPWTPFEYAQNFTTPPAQLSAEGWSDDGGPSH